MVSAEGLLPSRPTCIQPVLSRNLPTLASNGVIKSPIRSSPSWLTFPASWLMLLPREDVKAEPSSQCVYASPPENAGMSLSETPPTPTFPPFVLLRDRSAPGKPRQQEAEEKCFLLTEGEEGCQGGETTRVMLLHTLQSFPIN